MKEKVYKETKIRIKNGEQEIKWVKVGNKKKRLEKVKGNCKILTQTCQHFKEEEKKTSLAVLLHFFVWLRLVLVINLCHHNINKIKR